MDFSGLGFAKDPKITIKDIRLRASANAFGELGERFWSHEIIATNRDNELTDGFADALVASRSPSSMRLAE